MPARVPLHLPGQPEARVVLVYDGPTSPLRFEGTALPLDLRQAVLAHLAQPQVELLDDAPGQLDGGEEVTLDGEAALLRGLLDVATVGVRVAWAEVEGLAVGAA